MNELKVGMPYVALVAPGSIDAEQDAMIFGSMAHAVRWVRAQLRAQGRPVYGRSYAYRRTDGTLDGDTALGACWPCFGMTLRQGFGFYRVVPYGNGTRAQTIDRIEPGQDIEWHGFDYVSGAITAGPRGGVRIEEV